LVTTIADSAIPLLSHEVPEKISLSACQLLLSVVITVRPKFFLSLPSVQKLLERATSEALEQLPVKVYIIWNYLYMYMYVTCICEFLESIVIMYLYFGCHPHILSVSLSPSLPTSLVLPPGVHVCLPLSLSHSCSPVA
jgi:hypothetical protein